MEIPRYWRGMKVSVSFTGKEVGTSGTEVPYFIYPGSGVLLTGTYEEVYSRFESKGFKPEAIEEILFDLFGAIASKPAISFEKVINSQSELVGREVRKQSGGKNKLGIDRLPRKITGKTLFTAGTNY